MLVFLASCFDFFKHLFFETHRHIEHIVFNVFYHTARHDSQRTVFRYAQKACEKDFFGEKLFFLIKIFNFYQKKQLPSEKNLLARLLSVAKNSALYVMPNNMGA